MKYTFCFVAAAPLLLAGSAAAQEWPAKPIRFLNPNASGGWDELVARIMAPVIDPRIVAKAGIQPE